MEESYELPYLFQPHGGTERIVRYAGKAFPGAEIDLSREVQPVEMTGEDFAIVAVPNYGFWKDEENNLLYTEEKRHVIFMDGSQPLEEISYWAFVEDAIVERGCSKDGYTLVGWYQDEALTQAWNFKTDVLPRGEGEFPLYAKWETLPAEAPALPKEETRNLPCDFEDAITLTPDFAEDGAYA